MFSTAEAKYHTIQPQIGEKYTQKQQQNYAAKGGKVHIPQGFSEEPIRTN
jgi:hypothetical protein